MACLTTDKTDKRWRFEILNDNTGEMSITDPLLDTQDRAEERAMSEFLKNSYAVNGFTFKTYRTDLVQNQTVNIGGLPFLVKNITYSIDIPEMVTTVTVVRYEN